MALEFVDADAHVVEADLARQCLERWPDTFTLAPDGLVMIEGRRYPESSGPGAGCPPARGLNTTGGINPYSPEGVLADAQRDGLDSMVFYPSFGLCTPTIRTRDVATGFAEFYNEWVADWCSGGKGRFRAVAVLPVEYVDDSIAVLRNAK